MAGHPSRGGGVIKLELDIDGDEATALVERIAGDLRAGALVRAARAAGKIVVADARPRITAPGYRGDKAGLKPLRKSLTYVIRDYTDRVIVVIGTAWPEGAHGHLVELGHIGKRKDGSTYHVPPHPFLRPAAEATRTAQGEAILAELRKAAK